jgi:hypothetical protein
MKLKHPLLPGVRGMSFTLVLCAGISSAWADLPPAWNDTDIGAPARAGAAGYTNGYWIVTGGGSDIWGAADQFNLASQSLVGDGMIIGRVLSQNGSDPWSKSGVMIRNDFTAGSPEVSVFITPGNGVAFQYRAVSGGQSTAPSIITGISTPVWLRLSRSGNTFTGSYSTDGVSWSQLGSPQTIAMNSSAQAGLAVTAHNNALLNTAKFNSVLVTAGPQVNLSSVVPRPAALVGETTWPLPHVPVGTNNLHPPMGWSFWNAFAGACDDQLTRQMVDALVSTGLRDAGYSYVLAFDGEWLTTAVPNGHDAQGNIIIDSNRWPNGIQSVCDYIHTNGLKVAGYSDIGVTGYGGPPEWGSFNYYQQDADQFAAWGWDYLKIDDAGPGDFYAAAQTIANNSSGRSMVLSFSTPQTYALDFGPRICNMWRVSYDITGNLGYVTWGDILREFDSDDAYWFAQAPGTWPDLDMLAVGLYGISDTEGRSHFNMWVIRGAPLIIGTDVRSGASASPPALGPPLSAATLATLSNPEAIAVDQDPLCACGVKVANGVYAKPLGTFTSGDYAVLLLNRSSSAISITVNWTDLGLLPGLASVRDLWAHQNLGQFTNFYTSPSIPAHGSMLLTISGAFDWSQPRTYEAEWAFNTFKENAHAVSQAAAFSNNGYTAGVGSGAANTLQFNRVAAPANGVYEVDVYYVGSVASSAQLSVNGGTAMTVSFPATGSGTTVGAIPLYLPLVASTNTLLFGNATGMAPNFDKLVVVSSNKVTGLVASVVNGQVTLTWNGMAGAASYNVYCGTNSGGEGATPIVTGLISPTYNDTGVIIWQTYYYTVTAVNPALGGEGAPSAEVSVVVRGATSSTAYQTAVLAGNPVAYWRLNETSGTTAYDDVGGYNGTYGSTVILGATGPRPPDDLGFELTNTAVQVANGVSNAWMTVPALNLNTNTVTITCWLKPSSVQAPWAGVFYCRGGSTVAGLDFGGNGTALGYTWNNDLGTYGWSSGVTPPVGVWSFSALVIQPTQVTIYLGTASGLTSANNTYNHPPQAFEVNSEIGTDTYSSLARAFSGLLDEVAIYNTALTPVQIQQLYENGFQLPQVQMGIQQSGPNLILNWPQGVLFQANNLNGPWTAVTSATSPYIVHPAAGQTFYRVRLR